MKSEKARQELDDGSWKVEINCEGKELDEPYRAVGVDVAEYAVELAEQEAEERMREKAVKAYCHDCCCSVVGKCEIRSENCMSLRDFIQKLTE